MKYTLQSLAALTISSFIFMGGCVTKLTTVDFDYSANAVVETSEFTATGTHTLGETTTTSTLKEELEKNNTNLDLLDQLTLKTVSVSIDLSNNPDLNFDGISGLELYISADNQPEVLIASKASIEPGSTEVILDVNSNEDLKPYLSANTFTYRMKGTNTLPIPAMTLNVHASCNVQASAK